MQPKTDILKTARAVLVKMMKCEEALLLTDFWTPACHYRIRTLGGARLIFWSRSESRGGKVGMGKKISPELFTLTSVCRTRSAPVSPRISETPVRVNWRNSWAPLGRCPPRTSPSQGNEFSFKVDYNIFMMNTCAFLLLLSVQIYADGIEGPTGKTDAGSVSKNSAKKFLHQREPQIRGKAERVWWRCQLCAHVFLLRLSAACCPFVSLTHWTVFTPR